MSKASHSFSVEIAKQEGLAEAIILQHIHFLQSSGADSNLPAKEVWVKRSVRACHLTYEYLTDRQIRNALDRLEERGVIRSKTDNKVAYDRTKSFQLDEKGWRYFQPEKPISETENAFDKKSNGSDEKSNGIARNVKSNIGSYSSFIDSFVECESAHAPAPENETLKAEKNGEGRVAPPAAAAPPPPKTDTALTYDQYPNARTADELQDRLRAYFTANPNEWHVGVLERAKAAKWPLEKTQDAVLRFCLHKEKSGDMRRTFGQYRADLTTWFLNQPRFDETGKAASGKQQQQDTNQPYYKRLT